MPQGSVNWKSIEAWQRLVSAIIATGVKVTPSDMTLRLDSDAGIPQIDIKKAADYYGTSYDTLEGRLRPLKKEAELMKTEVEKGQVPDLPATIALQPSTPKKATRNTPKKKGADGGMKTGATSDLQRHIH